jgi:hypothetical protein
MFTTTSATKLIAALLLPVGLWAANATAVNISTVSRSANVVTVTCSATCGIAANFGFCIAGVTDTTFNVCGVAVTGSGTTYTFNQTASNGSSSGGTSTAAKQIIFLGNQTAEAGKVTVSYILWNYTLTGKANNNASSVWGGASASENGAIKAGTFVEAQRSQTFPITANQGQIDQWAQNEWLANQNAIAATFAPGANVGCYCDPVGCGC